VQHRPGRSKAIGAQRGARLALTTVRRRCDPQGRDGAPASGSAHRL